MKRARLIYNPTSGREEMKKKLADILDRLERGGIETSCHATIGEGDATLAAAAAVDRKFDIVIAAGGDGTLNEVVSGLAERAYRPQLGIIPLGTTNDFARAIGIPRQWESAVDIIIRQHTRKIDIGKVNEKYFVNIAGGGSLTELTYEVPSKLKTMIGQLAYYMKGLEKLPRLKPSRLKIMCEELVTEDEFMLFLISNSNSVGGFEKLAPFASLDDGYFDVLLLKKCNLADFIKIVTLALRGEHLNDDHIIHFHTKRIEVFSDDYIQLNLDGEFGGTLPCTFTNLPAHLNVLVDETGTSNYHMRRQRHEQPEAVENEESKTTEMESSNE